MQISFVVAYGSEQPWEEGSKERTNDRAKEEGQRTPQADAVENLTRDDHYPLFPGIATPHHFRTREAARKTGDDIKSARKFYS